MKFDITAKRRSLSSLECGQSGHVLAVNINDKRTRRHLMDMGITPGTEITLVKLAPMGDPMEIALRGYTMSIRKADAQSIILMNEEDHRAWHEEAQRDMLLRQQSAAAQRNTAGDRRNADKADHDRAAELTSFILSKNMCGDKKSLCPKGAFDDDRPVRLALAGNPNCGKTTLFNALTGSKEYVGNWPGVTVEKKEGKIKQRSCKDGGEGVCTMGHEMSVVDLPGIYSLSPYSMEEIVARNYIINDSPDAVINIVDATNLERNLYLTIQLLELEKPLILALNMMDEVAKKGDGIDCKALSRELGIPVVPISARTGEGLDELVSGLQSLIAATHTQMHQGFTIEPDDVYDDFTHQQHHRLGELTAEYAKSAGLPLHWAEIKLLEGDELVRRALDLPQDVQKKADDIIAEYAAANPVGDNESQVADSRYKYIESVAKKAYIKSKKANIGSKSAKIDALLTHKFFALPIFILIMGAIFMLTFSTVGAFLADGVGGLIEGLLAPWAHSALEQAGAGQWFISLICDGVIKGVGGVITFLPQMALLFFFLSLLEDSGYMSRIAFIMDKPMRRFGLSGKSFIPLLMGFGCTVPAAMGARTMDNERDRRMTILLLPFMSCSAKLPVYGLIAGAFFGKYRGLVILSLYALGIMLGILSGLILRRAAAFNKGEAPFVIELPPYRVPSMRNVLTHVWERVSHFIEKAGTVIFAMSVVLWFLQSFDFALNYISDPAKSILGSLGGFIAPLFAPLGFGSWQASVSLLSGVVAKEAVVSSLSMFANFGVGAQSSVVHGALSGIFTPAAAYAFLVFVLLYTPCMAALATIRREMHSAKWTAFAIVWQIGSAYIAAFLFYNITGLFTGETDKAVLFYGIAAIMLVYSLYCILARKHKGCDGNCARCGACNHGNKGRKCSRPKAKNIEKS